jgi:hypothetical protein
MKLLGALPLGIFASSGYIGHGSPAVTQHPVTPEQCMAKLRQPEARL